MLTAATAGLLTGLGLIVAIGAQNAFVLRQGLTREHIGIVVTICVLSDALLITLGTMGVGAVVQAHPHLLTALKIIGALYLAGFGIRSLLSARRPGDLEASGSPRPRSSIVATTLALTYLNPHVYLDTVLMLGNLANQHGPTGRWWFAGGGAVASLMWFSCLGYGARSLAGRLARPGTWQVLDLIIGVVMLTLAALLAFG